MHRVLTSCVCALSISCATPTADIAETHAEVITDFPPDVGSGPAPGPDARVVDPEVRRFFERVKQEVASRWNPQQALGAAYAFREDAMRRALRENGKRATVVEATVSAEGQLKDIRVAKQSGIDALDQEALAAFRRADHFGPVPARLLNGSTGDFRFKFGFAVEKARSN